MCKDANCFERGDLIWGHHMVTETLPVSKMQDTCIDHFTYTLAVWGGKSCKMPSASSSWSNLSEREEKKRGERERERKRDDDDDDDVNECTMSESFNLLSTTFGRHRHTWVQVMSSAVHPCEQHGKSKFSKEKVLAISIHNDHWTNSNNYWPFAWKTRWVAGTGADHPGKRKPCQNTVLVTGNTGFVIAMNSKQVPHLL